MREAYLSKKRTSILISWKAGCSLDSSLSTVPLPLPSPEFRWEVFYLHSKLALFVFRLSQLYLRQLNQNAVKLLLKIFRAGWFTASLVKTISVGRRRWRRRRRKRSSWERRGRGEQILRRVLKQWPFLLNRFPNLINIWADGSSRMSGYVLKAPWVSLMSPPLPDIMPLRNLALAKTWKITISFSLFP